MGSTKEREFKGTLQNEALPALHVYNVPFLLQNSTTSGSYYIFSPRKLHSWLFWPHPTLRYTGDSNVYLDLQNDCCYAACFPSAQLTGPVSCEKDVFIKHISSCG